MLWVSYGVFGLGLGAIFALLACGIVLVYRATGVLNLAFGAVGAFGAFLAWEIVNNTHMADGVGYVLEEEEPAELRVRRRALVRLGPAAEVSVER